jgi:hypothetical protein
MELLKDAKALGGTAEEVNMLLNRRFSIDYVIVLL